MTHQDWYKGLWNWESFESAYEAYIPCLVPLPTHLNVALAEKSILQAGESNSILRFIKKHDMCVGLSDDVLKAAVMSSYNRMCPFPKPRQEYSPVFNPELTCAFNAEEHQIHLNEGASCPEGHRCACPVYSEWETLQSAAKTASTSHTAANAVTTSAQMAMTAAATVGVAAPVVAPVAFGLAMARSLPAKMAPLEAVATPPVVDDPYRVLLSVSTHRHSTNSDRA